MKFTKSRLESFSDGVMAIIMTIMVLNIPLPKSFGFNDVLSLLMAVLVFFVSFFVVGFFWHQHYRLFYLIDEVTTMISWRNMLFLFSLSLMPVFTKWVIENLGQVVPALGYTIVFILVNLTFQFLFSSARKNKEERNFNFSGKVMIAFFLIWFVLFAGIIALCFFQPLVASILLIGLPVLFSLSNLWFEHPRREHRGFAGKGSVPGTPTKQTEKQRKRRR